MGNVPAIPRALAVLRALAARAEPAPAAALARELALPRSSVYHLLAELEAEGCVVRVPEERAYALGPTVFELSAAYLRADPLTRLARPLLARLAEDLRHPALLAVLHGAETRYLAVERPHPPGREQLVADAGVRLPAALTATGRAILAQLPRAQVRAVFPAAEAFTDRTGRGPRTPAELRRVLDVERVRGWSEEDGEITDGIATVAACATDRQGRAVAAFGVGFRSAAVPPGPARDAVARYAQAAASRLSTRLGTPH